MKKRSVQKTRTIGKSSVAIFETMILVVSMIAFAYFVGAEFKVVSATEQCVVSRLSGSQEKVSGIPNVKTWCRLDGGVGEYCSCSSPGDSGASCNTGGGTWTWKKTVTCSEEEQSPSTQQQVASSAQQAIVAPISNEVWNRVRGQFGVGATTGTAVTTGTTGISPTLSGAASDAINSGALSVGGPTTKKTLIEWVKNPFSPSSGAAGGKVTAAKLTFKVAAKVIVKNAAIAYGIYYGVKAVLGDRVSPEQAEQIARSAGWGYMAYAMAAKGIFGSAVQGFAAGPWGFVIGLAVAAVTYIFSGDKHYNNVVFSCNPWVAPAGGKDCEKCNNGEFPCTEYRCKSLGQSCELLNKGTSDELCTWTRRNDVNPPVIQPWRNVLTSGYIYTPDNTISPPDRGVKIVPDGNANGCVKPYTPLRFGLTVNETAKCSIDTEPRSSFKDMRIPLSSGLLKYNHSFQLSLPSPDALAAENITLENGGKMAIYARCKDAANNSNVENFVFKFCVDDGPDRTQPRIVTTSVLNGNPIAFGQSSINLDIFVNEPSECNWSHLDRTYEDMENKMTCVTGATEYNTQMLYKCSTTLTGLKDAVDNDFYFRCRDQPHLANTVKANERNTNLQSYKLTLKGTRPLVITSAGPNNTKMVDSTNVIKVNLTAKTSVGYKDGEAMCSFKNEATTGSTFVDFYNTGKNVHSQELWLPAASYRYNITCTDLGGNTDSKIINFTVETDTTAPTVVRVFRQENSLKVITNEESYCVYGGSDCDYQFSDGTNMSKAVNGTEHTTPWKTDRTYFIKCSDKFGNQVVPNSCNIIARPFEIK